MDPNANIAEQRQLAAEILADDERFAAESIRLAELVDALDTWRRRGGFDPYAAPEHDDGNDAPPSPTMSTSEERARRLEELER